MKKNKIKYVLIPAFAAATLFPVLANDNQAEASEDKTTTASNVSNTVSTNEKTTAVNNSTNNTVVSTPASPATPVNNVASTSTNNELTNSASVESKEVTKPTIPFTVAEYKQKSALELAKLIREKKVTSTELVDLAYKVIEEENPKLNAVLTTENGKIPHAIVEEAYKTAKEIDNRISAGKLAANPVNWDEQPFLGVPTLIKGLDALKNGDSSYGVYLNKGKTSSVSGAVAKEFAKLGFVILGQTNYPEFGTRNITDSKLLGPAGNPWDPSRNTGGSSGGSALISEKIYKKLKKLTVPIYVSMGDLCASGGYYIATTGQKLFANNLTLTGSIGVVMMYPEVVETLKKLDVNLEGFEKGTGFDMLNPFEKLGEDSKEKIIYNMSEVYTEFKEHVMKTRGMNDEELEKIAQGRVWLGSEARNINLIDEIGSFEECIKSMADDLKLDKYKVRIIELTQTIKETLTDIKLPFVSEEIKEKIEFLQGNMNQVLYYENDFEL